MKKEISELRWGISTGTCAAAAAKASALRLIGGIVPPSVVVALPSGEAVELPVVELEDGRCGVVKDAGDDLDSTDGVTVAARVRFGEGMGPAVFIAGEGVGTVTLPGLKLPPGEPAINPVPRRMIERAVREAIANRTVTDRTVADRMISIEISIPGGAILADRTFNKRLGIEGGLSILGTTGRVRPMDVNALLESLSLEISTQAARGRQALLLTFASTGEASARKAWGIPEGFTVQVANEIGFALDECVRLGLQGVVLAGHPGKLLKVAAGSFDTHNRVADGRFEVLCTHIALTTGSCALLPEIYACRTTEAAMAVLRERLSTDVLRTLWNSLAERAAVRCSDRIFGELETAAAFIDGDGNVLGASRNLDRPLERLRAQ